MRIIKKSKLFLFLLLIPLFVYAGCNTYNIDLESTSSQYLYVADTASLSITSDLTIEAWVKFESVGNMTPVAKWIDDTNQSYRFEYTGTALKLLLSSDGANFPNGSVAWTPSTDTWYHIAVSWTDSSNVAQFFVNGSQQGTDQTISSAGIYNGTAALCIGSDNCTTGTTRYFDGQIDDVRVWATARTGAQISANYQAELIGNETNLQGYWTLNNILTDATANGNNLTNANSATFVTTVPFTTGCAAASDSGEGIMFQLMRLLEPLNFIG